MNESGWISNGNGVLALALYWGPFLVVGNSSSQPFGRGGGVGVMLELLKEELDSSEFCPELCGTLDDDDDDDENDEKDDDVGTDRSLIEISLI